MAAHWRYKEQAKVGDRDEKVFSWLRQFVEWHRDLSDNQQFMDSVKLDLFHLDVFHDVVFAFTPKGEVKELPLGATPLDLAYPILGFVSQRSHLRFVQPLPSWLSRVQIPSPAPSEKREA